MLGLKDVDLRLRGQTFDLPAPDPEFTRQVSGILAGSMDDYGLAVLDLTDPAKPRYAEHRGDHQQNVGSVGKLVVALALFQALADTYPDDIEARRRVLKDTVVTADGFSQYDSPHRAHLRSEDADAHAAAGADRRPGDAVRMGRLDALAELELRRRHGDARSDARPAVRQGLSAVGGRDQAASSTRRRSPS